jgi:hypothetical protein
MLRGHGLGHIHPDSADKILRAAFIELGIEGASTHSFRRTCLTQMHRASGQLLMICEDFRSQNFVCIAEVSGSAGGGFGVGDRYT